MRSFFFGILAALMVTPALALDCSPLAPTAPTDSDTSMIGKTNLAVDSFFRKLVNGNANVDATYRKVATNVLYRLPNANKVYIWERVLFLQCELLSESRDLTSEQKLTRAQLIMDKIGSDPPPIQPNPLGGNPPPTQSNTLTNSGNGAQIIQGGNGNSINAK